MSRGRIFEPDPETTYYWVWVPFQGIKFRVKLAVTGDNFEIVDFYPPHGLAWDWDFIDRNQTEILMNIPLA